MQNIKTLILPVLSAVLLTACAGPRYQLSPSLQPGQSTRFEQGSEVVESKKRHLVAVRPLRQQVQQKQRLQFLVVVGNQEEKTIELDHSDVALEINGVPARTYSFEQQKQEIEGAAAAMAMAAAVNQASASMNAAFAQSSLNSALTPSAGLSQRLNHANNGLYYAQQADYYQNAANQAQLMSAMTASQVGGLGGVLRRTSIAPGSAGGGTVTSEGIRSDDSQAIHLRVRADGEDHRFVFQVEPVQE